MTKLLLFIVSLTLLANNGLTIKQDPVFPDQSKVYMEGKEAGTIRRDPVFEDRYNVYDKDGNKTGTIERDPVLPDTWRLEDE